MGKDYIIYAKYQAMRNASGKIVNMKVLFASSRFVNVLGYNPVGKMRTELFDYDPKIYTMIQNVLDFGVPKHYTYYCNLLGHMEEMIEPDLSTKDCVNIYSVDIHQLRQDDNEQNLRNNVSTLLSMFNVTLLHWNAAEHYIYSDNILTTNFHENNADLYVGNNVRSSFDLYHMVNAQQRTFIETQIKDLIEKKVDFVSFDLIIQNSVRENAYLKVNIIAEDKPNMYLIGIQF